MKRQTQVEELASAIKEKTRKDQTHSTAFVVGFVIAGLAGAGLALWKAPQSGAKTRQLIADRTEGTLFNLMGMRDYLTGEKVPTAIAALRAKTEAPALQTAGSGPARSSGSAPDADTDRFQAVDDSSSALPPTFRGQPLIEKSSGETPYGPLTIRS